MNPGLRVTLAVIAIAAAALLGFGAYRWFAAPEREASVASRMDESATLPQSQEPARVRERKLVATRPVFSLRDQEGSMRSITEWDGKSLVINFWATWCAPCRREIPMLNELHEQLAGQGVEVIGIAIDFRDAVLEYAKKMGIDYPILIGEQEGLDAAAAFGIAAVGLPFTVFTDKRGRVVTAHLGELHRHEADVILEAVAAINSGETSLEAGQQRIASGLKEAGRRNATNP